MDITGEILLRSCKQWKMKNLKNSLYFSILKLIKKKIIIAVFDSYMYYLLFIIKINPNKCVIQMFIDLLIQKKMFYSIRIFAVLQMYCFVICSLINNLYFA